MFYYQINKRFNTNDNTLYYYEQYFDYFLSAISDNVFESVDGSMICVKGEYKSKKIKSTEAMVIILSAKPKCYKISNNFDPGHA